jgi:hypothetical protein
VTRRENATGDGRGDDMRSEFRTLAYSMEQSP